ncbi:Regulatory protein RecX [Rubrobacter xylanophilus DSM 9941]|uniref:regulatory protein RecX n=1 Tax=Rubrobacter xylanophilus TaxID=49319 RepID=UPI001C640058|nr:regulatory protein RecX [Rubrobacter xylanophilus]QYJ14659.1 Regulatory protein RecX [Rubrobacter xylanophilus DSM 9941]
MPRITRIRERRGRVRVFIDGGFWAELEADFAAGCGLFEGAELEEEELDALRVEGERALAMSRALNLLGYRPRSEKEVRERLRRFGHPEGVVQAVVERLRELGYVDDEEFARQLSREKGRRYGPRRVAAELRRRGVDDELADRVVEEAFAGRSQLEEARRAAARRYNRGGGSDYNRGGGSDAQARRVYGFLMRRGYPAEVCARVAREYRADPPEEA